MIFKLDANSTRRTLLRTAAAAGMATLPFGSQAQSAWPAKP